MPAESKKQQRFFGLVKAIQEGKATGSAKAKEVAKSMPHKSVRDYAATSHEDLPESKKESMDPNVAQLLRYAAISAGVGLGGAGLYGLTKYIHDKSLLGPGQGREARIKRREKLLAIPKSRQLGEILSNEKAEESVPVNQAEMLADNSENQNKSDLTPAMIEDMRNPDEADVYKSSSLGSLVSEYVGEPFLAGALTPMAAIAPGIATYVIGKKLIDQHRKAKLQSEIDKAKKEFESVLSKTSSDLQQQVDELYKSADYKFTPLHPADRPMISVPALPEAAQPAAPGFGITGLSYILGLAPGAGALLGWALMNRHMKKDPDKQKLKELNNLLKRDIASGALSSGIDLEEGKEGKPTFKL